MQRMQFSGYEKKFKGEVVKSAFKAYRTIIEKDERGEQPLYRPKMWKRVERQKERRINTIISSRGREHECDFCACHPWIRAEEAL